MTLPTQSHRNSPAKQQVARKKKTECVKFAEVHTEGIPKQGLLKREDAIVLGKLRLMEGEFENWISKYSKCAHHSVAFTFIYNFFLNFLQPTYQV
mmetsp:Transcript_16248/g.22798  ORF Transcript_16248/g.22798 Transcript_16248/m.22798 type:complete len:95 (-) Transcript_16248:821-1105(-)